MCHARWLDMWQIKHVGAMSLVVRKMKDLLIVNTIDHIVVNLLGVIHAIDLVNDSLPVSLDRNDLDIFLVITLNHNIFHVLLDEILPLFDDMILFRGFWRPNGFIRMNKCIAGRKRKSIWPPLDLMEIRARFYNGFSVVLMQKMNSFIRSFFHSFTTLEKSIRPPSNKVDLMTNY